MKNFEDCPKKASCALHQLTGNCSIDCVIYYAYKKAYFDGFVEGVDFACETFRKEVKKHCDNGNT